MFRKVLTTKYFPLSFGSLMIFRKENCSRNDESEKSIKSEIIFLGTGSSSGVPYIYDLMANSSNNTLPSIHASQGDPKTNKSYRCNPSILIKHNSVASATTTNILIDAGKTFRESAVRWFPHHDIRTIDAVILTHGHADAIFGLDEIRATQGRPSLGRRSSPLPIYQSKECKVATKRIFDYLYPDYYCQSDPTAASGQCCGPVVARFVASVDWRDMTPYVPLLVQGLTFLPVPVMHGEDMFCMGFLFGAQQKVCYLSDISRMLPETIEAIVKHSPIDLLICDALHVGRMGPGGTHFGVDDALDLCREIRPKRALLIGMCHSVPQHEEMNLKLRELLLSEGLDVQLAFDGMSIELDL